MTILSIDILLFIALEASNVIVLYAKPGSRLANGIGIFDAWEKSKQDPELHRFVSYLVYWVAGTKLIFIALLVVIVLTGSFSTLVGAAAALVLSILSFFWRLFPLVRQLDVEGHVTPRGYSSTLARIIGSMVVVFSAAVVAALILR